jgi:lipopolysaccharide transport system ATP-binding protein
MSNIAISADGLGKQYRIGQKPGRYRTFRESVSKSFFSPFRRAGKLLLGQLSGASELNETFWALKDISFFIERGEVVGIIGRNGAGKSTLLKILSRITEPTAGTAEIHGRVGSLLEVGTGFHMELTGRENIYLNGAILGMRRAEIEHKFDEIVAFAEVDKFIDTPVKHYSSGMYLRLAFAVAAHLETDILLVDEVLAVGDAQFQQKCLGKMGEFSKKGRTVLFVSHNMGAIQSLCPTAILLDNGVIKDIGESTKVISNYLHESSKQPSYIDLSQHQNRIQGGTNNIKYIRYLDINNAERTLFSTNEHVVFEVSISSNDVIRNPHLGIGVDNSRGQRIFTLQTRAQNIDFPSFQGERRIRCTLQLPFITPGKYFIKLAFGTAGNDIDVINDISGFEVIAGDLYDSGKLPTHNQGIIYVFPSWEMVS